MKTTIDRAGRLVVPKALRDAIGLEPGDIEISVVGSTIRIEPVVNENLVERGGWLVVAGAGPISPDEVRDLRLRDQR